MLRRFASLGFLTVIMIAVAAHSHAQQNQSVWEVFDGAESRFQQPPESWFYETQQALREEAIRFSSKLDLQGAEYATAWKEHLHWHLLEKNYQGEPTTINVDELRLVRRWLYSNREGLETSYFAELRRTMNEHLDAAITFSYVNLESEFHQQLALARQLCRRLVDEPTDANAAALGRVIGWFETTRQIPEEVAAVRKAMSLPNAQLVVSQKLLHRIVVSLAPEVSESVKVVDVERLPPSGILNRSRKVKIVGTANTRGVVGIEMEPNEAIAEVNLVYQGEVESRCRAIAGPVTMHLHTLGTASAIKPIFFGLTGLTVKETVVTPKIRNTLEGVSGKSALLRRLGERQANKPDARAHKDKRARDKAVELLKNELDQRVETVLDEIRSEVVRNQAALSEFGNVTAPLLREGATPYFHSTSSTPEGVVLNAFSGRSDHFGAPFPCPVDAADTDLQARVHVSFVNNLAETILGGKTITDTFFMRYAKVIHAQLPIPLMVHSRSQRWTVTMAKHRPLELVIPKPNHFQFVFRATEMEIDGVQYTGPLTAKFTYAMQDAGFGEIDLVRVGDIELETAFDTNSRMFLYEKLTALFAPAFRGGGVIIPDGGLMGTLRNIQSTGIQAANQWITIGVSIPDSVLKEVLKFREQQAEKLAS